MLSLPLVNVLHAESCAVLAFAACFTGGLDAVSRLRSGESLPAVLRWEFGFLLIPLVLYQLSRLVVPGCDLATGLRYFVLFPAISLIAAISLAYLLTARSPQKAGRRFVALVFAVLLITLLWDLGFHPQFYVYNHVFGGVLGPIYDLHHADRLGLYVFRGMTLLWAGLFALVGLRLRSSGERRLTSVFLPVISALLALGYWFGPQLGINTTHETIAGGLGSRVETEHFEIHYDERVVTASEIVRIAEDHEYRYAMMAMDLGFGVGEKILSYIYPTAAVRASLTGAGYTDVAPVWLSRPQIHILYDSYDQTFAHELAHVFSRDMGLPVLGASLRVGLVEGFAVAMEPPIGLPSPSDQVAAIRNAPDFDSLYGGRSLASSVIASLSPFGFWSGRGAVSYTTMGSFVRYLLDTYGPDPFRRVYGMESFESAYGVRLTDLAEDWEASLLGRELPEAVAALAAGRFSVLSIFERHCPHDTPRAVRRFWDALDHMQFRDTTAAKGAVDDVLKIHPDFAPGLSLWARLELQRGRAGAVRTRLNPVLSADTMMAAYLGLSMGDALAMEGRRAEASAWYDRTMVLQSPYSRSLLAVLRLRKLLIDRPELIAALNDVGGRAAAHGVLGDSGEGAALVLGSVASALDYNYAAAFGLIRETAGTAAADTAGARWYAWAASFAFRAGELEEAERFRSLAVQAARTEGDMYEIARLADFGRRIEWSRQRKA
ncbi:MAG TPA: hypothetical protein VMO47_00120 [Rhodothermales bacterium]|nr:hypothetical protein [Rhodothermales bacterium]